MGFSYELNKRFMKDIAKESKWLSLIYVEGLSYTELLRGSRVNIEGKMSISDDGVSQIKTKYGLDLWIDVANKEEIDIYKSQITAEEIISFSNKEGRLHVGVSAHKTKMDFLFCVGCTMSLNSSERGPEVSAFFDKGSLTLRSGISPQAAEVYYAKTFGTRVRRESDNNN